MITRIEIDGFKSFRNFALDFEPFQVFIGPNGAGKSNLFDAIALLNKIAKGNPFLEAFDRTRGGTIGLFHNSSTEGRMKIMSFAVELLIGKTIDDGTGSKEVSETRLRYELKIQLSQEDIFPGLYAVEESLMPIPKNRDSWIEEHIRPEHRLKWLSSHQREQFTGIH